MGFTIGGDWISPEPPPKKQQRRPVKVRREKRGKSIITVVLNLPFDDPEIKVMAARLKKHCGCGGTVKKGVIELQGDNIENARNWLHDEGVKAQ